MKKKYSIFEEEYYPYCSLSEQNDSTIKGQHGEIVLSEMEYNNFKDIVKMFEAWQDRLREKSDSLKNKRS